MSYNPNDIEVPAGWIVSQLGELVEINSAQVDPSATPKASFNYVAMENVEKGTGKLINFSPTPGEKIGSSKNAFKAGDVLYGKLRPYLRKTIVAPFDGVSVTDLIALRPRAGISPEFVKYFLLSPYHMEHIELLMAGIRMPRIRTEDLLKIPIPTPPYDEQCRIVVKLEELLTRADACQERLEQVPRLLKQFRQSVLAAACSGRLTVDWRSENLSTESAEILLENIAREKNRLSLKSKRRLLVASEADVPFEVPETWTFCFFDDIAANKPNALKAGPFGSSLKKSCYVPSGYKVYGQEQVIRGDASYGDYFINEAKFQELLACEVSAGDLLVSLVGTIGKVLVIPDNFQRGIINPRLVKISLHSNVSSLYIEKYLTSPLAKNILSQDSHGGTMEILNLGILKTLPIPLPPEKEQQEIVQRVEALLKIADVVENHYSKAQEQLDKLPQAILAKAFRGELVPQDPHDEPAPALLERIKAGRAQAVKPEKKPKRQAAAKSQSVTGRSTLF